MDLLHSKFASFLCLHLVLKVAIASDCLSIFPSYQINTEQEATNRGCYHSPGRGQIITDGTFVNFRKTIDWSLWGNVGHAKDLIKKCGEKAAQSYSMYFGIEFYGECYHGNKTDTSLGRVTVSDGCDRLCSWDVGGPLAMVLYEVSDWGYSGCQAEHTGYRYIPTKVAWSYYCGYKNVIGKLAGTKVIDFKHLADKALWNKKQHAGDMITRCAREAEKLGFMYIGIHDYGLCYMATYVPIATVDEVPAGKDCDQHCKWDMGTAETITFFILYKV